MTYLKRLLFFSFLLISVTSNGQNSDSLMIRKIYDDEQSVDFPIFNVRFSGVMRGIFVDVNPTDDLAMRSSILFYGRKPLLI